MAARSASSGFIEASPRLMSTWVMPSNASIVSVCAIFPRSCILSLMSCGLGSQLASLHAVENEGVLLIQSVLDFQRSTYHTPTNCSAS